MTCILIFKAPLQLSLRSVSDRSGVRYPYSRRAGGRTRIPLGAAAAAIAAFSLSRPFPKITEDETAVAVLPESTRVIQHDVEFFIFKLSPSLEILKINAE